MRAREISIRITETATQSWRLTASMSDPHRGSRGVRMVPMRTVTRTLSHPYASELSPDLLTELVTALTLVAAGWYEQPGLPFGED
jgi:hypothetical protein